MYRLYISVAVVTQPARLYGTVLDAVHCWFVADCGRCNGFSCAGLEGRCNSDSVFTRSWLRQSNHAWQLQQVSQQVQQVSVDGPQCCMKGLDVTCARLLTDRVLFHAHTTHSVTEVSLSRGLVSGIAFQDTYATRISHTAASGVNSRRIGFPATGAQCDILLNCAL